MQVNFLGTGASEGIPNPFCSCHICELSRIHKGYDIRTRSSVVIDNRLQIDIAPEYTYQLMRDCLDAREITNLFFTHTHPDHFNIGELYSRMVGFSHNISHPLNVFGNDLAITKCAALLENFSHERIKLHKIVPFTTTETHGYRITPLLANHALWEFCYVYLIEKDSKVVFYGHDSGWFPELTWRYLKNYKIDLCILECTIGYNSNNRTDGHMSFETIIDVKEKLKSSGCLNKTSEIILSHISHNVKMNHAEIESNMSPHDIKVAYDGLIVVV
ncbi:MBL fold metallo-hydrolase [Erwinia mallotivora]|uniref:MBL fold metallo-hydrolase n=1 Tax=Erwinia mallotivora TaxID=69222 RepID=UPI0021BE4D56|nr:MBL fold metallo-hydrolase [Erwinia mallotivora]